MKIGINCRSIINPGYGDAGSAGHYTYYLVSELLRRNDSHEYFLYFDTLLGKGAVSRMAGRAGAVIRFFPFHAYEHELRGKYSSELFLSLAERDGLDVLHQPSPDFGEVIPGRTVFTVHNMSVFSHPEWGGREARGRQKRWKESLRSAAKIIVPTKFVKSEIARFLGDSSKKTSVVAHGLDLSAHHKWTEDVLSPSDHLEAEEVRGKFKLRDNFIASIGTLEPRKNMQAVLDAFKLIWEKNPKILEKTDLVFAGAKGAGADKFLHALRNLNKETGGRVKYLGYVSHQDRFALMEHATAFVYLSLHEGFGFSALEAAAFGTPVLVSSVPPLKETLGKAAVFAPPRNIREIAAALLNLLENKNLRQKIAAQGKKLPEKFSWKKTAEETLKIYEKIK